MDKPNGTMESHKVSSYPKIVRIGSKFIKDIWDGPVEITEKIDGSQFNFGKFDGKLTIRSHHKELFEGGDNGGMFKAGVEFVRSIFDNLPEGRMFHCEYLNKPKHNVIAYNKVPINGIICFGMSDGDGYMYSSYIDIIERLEIGIGCVPILFSGPLTPDDSLIERLLEEESILGGSKIEGFVVKRYNTAPYELNGQMTNVIIGKHVSEKFKEKHDKNWKMENTGKGKFEVLKDCYRSEARWMKSIQKQREIGMLQEDVVDIGPLIKAIQCDVREEEKENIKDELWKIFSGEILRKSIAGFPTFYKEYLKNAS